MKFRVEKSHNYTVLSNYHFKEKEMTLKAKGLLSLLLSLPDDWDYSYAGLEKMSKDGPHSLRSAVSELKKFGFLRIDKLRNKETGLFEYEYVISEIPFKTCSNSQTNPDTNFPDVDFPDVENHHLNKILSNKILSNKILNNNTTTIEDLDDSMVSQVVEGYDSWGCKVSVILLISNSQLADLNAKLSQDEFFHYLERMQHMLMEDYRFPCSHYDYILKMVMEDRRLKNG